MKAWLWVIQDVVFVGVALAIIAGVVWSIPYVKKNEDRWQFQAKTNKQEGLKRKIATQDMSNDLTKIRNDLEALAEEYNTFVAQQNSKHLEIDIDIRNFRQDIKVLQPIAPEAEVKKEETEEKQEVIRTHPYGGWHP